jgi:ABC-type amino acid transport substrate-binding protein
MTRTIISILAILLSQAAAWSQDLPTEVVLVNSPYPPYVMPEGDPKGPGIDMEIAMQALGNLGIGTTVRMVPFKRVLVMLEEGQADLTTSLSFRQERDSYLLWSRPYRTGASYAFFCRKGSAFMPGRLEDLRGRAVGVVRGFVFPPAFADDPAIRKVEAPNIASLMNMLLEGRFDALIVNSLAGRYELLATGRIAEVEQAPFTLVTPDDKGTFMGFSKARTRPELVERFNAEIERMAVDGTTRRIEGKYLEN